MSNPAAGVREHLCGGPSCSLCGRVGNTADHRTECLLVTALPGVEYQEQESSGWAWLVEKGLLGSLDPQ